MSHDATNWAIKQRGLKPATKIVLWHLCDRYHPDHGCFPSQENLAAECEMSRASLNTHLDALEAAKLIRRVPRIDPITKKQKSTAYRFAFEPGFEPLDVESRVQKSDTEAVSKNEPEPCPEISESRVQNLDTNPVREPVREPVRPPSHDVQAVASWEGDFNILWEGWPAIDRPDNKHAAATRMRLLSPEDRDAAIRHAAVYRDTLRKRNPKRPPPMIPYLREKLFLQFEFAPEIDAQGRFIIKPGRPEWGPWLGDIRAKYGERGVQSIVRTGYYLTEQRWPASRAEVAA